MDQEPEKTDEKADLKSACEHVGQIVADFLLDILEDLTVEMMDQIPERQSSVYARCKKYSEGLKR